MFCAFISDICIMKLKQLFLFVLVVGLVSCKKNKKAEPAPDPVSPIVNPVVAGNRQQLTIDSLYFYAQQIYFWNTSLHKLQ